MSQIWSGTTSPFFIFTFFFMKSAPIVVFYDRHDFLYWKLSIMLDFPTPESPITTIFKNCLLLDPEFEVAWPTVPNVLRFPFEKLVPRSICFSGIKLAPYSIFSFFQWVLDSSLALDVYRLWVSWMFEMPVNLPLFDWLTVSLLVLLWCWSPFLLVRPD